MTSTELSAIAVIPAAGIGQRMASQIPKQYLTCAGKPIIWHSLMRLQSCHWISDIYVCLSPDDSYWETLIGEQFSKVTPLVGGASRAESVANGLAIASQSHPDDTWALVHDAARPCLFRDDLNQIKKVMESCSTDGFILADKINDTTKRTNSAGLIESTVDRSGLWRALTPQLFKLGQLSTALASHDLTSITDEASAMEHQGFSVNVIQGDRRNIKITQPDDLILAELYLSNELK